ncbi:MAG: DUF547 domain-containing protein [Nitrospirales bacterium]|nr:DUF547 domain-containing protein [Nitrospirales bacterium]
MNRLLKLGLTLFLFTGCSTIPQTFVPPDPLPPQNFTTQSLDRALREHVHDGIVDYPALAEDRDFRSFIKQIRHVPPQQLPTPNHRLAFWINVYNALAIQGIMDGSSPETIIGRYTFFIGDTYLVGGTSLNLYDLEQDLLIPRFTEPRIHFAIVCASRSCPKLQSKAYTAEDLDRQLTSSARNFINDPARNHFDRKNRIAYLSKIFDWFSGDFANHSGSLLEYVARFVSDPDLAAELRHTPYTIEFLPYDWSLNGIPLPAKP